MDPDPESQYMDPNKNLTDLEHRFKIHLFDTPGLVFASPGTGVGTGGDGRLCRAEISVGYSITISKLISVCW